MSFYLSADITNNIFENIEFIGHEFAGADLSGATPDLRETEISQRLSDYQKLESQEAQITSVVGGEIGLK